MSKPEPHSPFHGKAWVLTETWRDGSDHIEGIALDVDAASAWVHSANMEFGHSRTSTPYNIVEQSGAKKVWRCSRCHREYPDKSDADRCCGTQRNPV